VHIVVMFLLVLKYIGSCIEMNEFSESMWIVRWCESAWDQTAGHISSLGRTSITYQVLRCCLLSP